MILSVSLTVLYCTSSSLIVGATPTNRAPERSAGSLVAMPPEGNEGAVRVRGLRPEVPGPGTGAWLLVLELQTAPPLRSREGEGGSRLGLENEKPCSGSRPRDLRPEAPDPHGTLVSFGRHRHQRSSRPLRRPNQRDPQPGNGRSQYSISTAVPEYLYKSVGCHPRVTLQSDFYDVTS